MLSILSKIFGGNKSQKDVKLLMPIVEKVGQFFKQYESLTNDELRGKTVEFRTRIKNHLLEIDNTIEAKKVEAEALPVEEINQRDVIYQQIDKLKKERDTQIEAILAEMQPETFAVVKETARRFTNNTEIVATATELDRELSLKKEHVSIQGDNVIYKNTWLAAGGAVTWNMVHYDVQLIGGSVLHQGKIAVHAGFVLKRFRLTTRCGALAFVGTGLQSRVTDVRVPLRVQCNAVPAQP